MLSPDVSDFPPPKVYVVKKDNQTVDTVFQIIRMNYFYKSVIVTCPDEHNMEFIEDVIADDSEYYRLPNCPITEFVNPNFIKYYVKEGKINCLSADTNCIVQNCAAITPDGILTLHVLGTMYQTLGLQGAKRSHGYYEIKIDLKNLNRFAQIKNCLAKLGVMDFYITWEPDNDNICPSSLAKYFWDRDIFVTSHKMTFENISPQVKQIPGLVDVEVEDLVEWMGILAHGGDVSPDEKFISTYSEPRSVAPIYSTRISILVAKGFLTPIVLNKLCKTLAEYVQSREPHNYWAAMSIQGHEESLWKFCVSSPRVFLSHNTSTSAVLSRNHGVSIYSTGQLKYF